MRVLLVEDDPDFAMLIAHFASKRRDWTLVGRAESLADAIELIEAEEPEVVLLDLGLPDSHGTDTVKAIVNRFHPLAIVVLTALDSLAIATEALRAGAQDYLDKSEASPVLLARTVRYARERARHTETIARQQRELADFATQAAHDLQAPLRSMTLFAELLEEDLGDRLSAREMDSVRHIVEGAMRMRVLIGDLMAYARAGHDDPFLVVDLMQLLAELHDEFHAELAESGVVVDIGYVPTVFGQAVPLRQALRSLLSNAIKFRRDASPMVRISGYEEDERVVIEVFDNGIGIPKGAISRAVMPFSRVHGAQHHPGSGLGLAVVERVVRRHGGRVRIDSDLGCGTTVRIDLPRSADAMATEERPEPSPRPHGRRPSDPSARTALGRRRR